MLRADISYKTNKTEQNNILFEEEKTHSMRIEEYKQKDLVLDDPFSKHDNCQNLKSH